MDPGDAAPVIPLWINGHAFLTVTANFHEVRDPLSAIVLRRTPLCDARVAQLAVAAAQAALAPWAARTVGARADLLGALAALLSSYAEHFSGLLAQEAGAAGAAAEVRRALALLRGDREAGAAECADPCAGPGAAQDGTEVVGIVAAASSPLYGPLRIAVPALLAGAVVIFKPSPATPSALYALAELSARCNFPAGVLSVVHGDEAATDGLRACGVRMLCA